MPKIIKNQQIIDDHWQLLKIAEGETAASVTLPDAPVLVPLAVWLARKQEVISRYPQIGVWLESDEEPAAPTVFHETLRH
jgi:uncharacterized protein (DUF934 family)